MLVLATSALVTGIKEETVETTKTIETAEVIEATEAVEIAGTGKNSEENKGGENPKSNLAQVPYIRYSITF